MQSKPPDPEVSTDFHRSYRAHFPSLAPDRVELFQSDEFPSDHANNCALMRLLGFYGRQFIRLFSLPLQAISFLFSFSDHFRCAIAEAQAGSESFRPSW
jgi:hypothetical protein